MHVRRTQKPRTQKPRIQRNLNQRVGLARLSDLVPAWFNQNADHTHAAGSRLELMDAETSTNNQSMTSNSVQLFFPSMSPSNH